MNEIEDKFIGWVSEDGNLEVIGKEGKDKRGRALYRAVCKVCSPDIELFPKEYFVCRKEHLLNDVKPCGCATNPKWSPEELLVVTKRAGAEKGVIVHGFTGDYKGVNTRVVCECPIEGYKWTTSANTVTHSKAGCPKCAGNARITEQEALEKCKDICDEMEYEVVGFVDGYKNTRSTFWYICPEHGIQKATYTNFTKQNGTRCPWCAKEDSGFYGWYPKRVDEQDYLYVMNFNDEYIKVGRSFNIKQRKKRLYHQSKCTNIVNLSIHTATHGEIYGLEQFIHKVLYLKGFVHKESKWSIETFNMDCLAEVDELLKGYNKVTVEE